MKKFTLLTIVSLCIFSIANAQITKGSVYFGGSIGYGNVDEETTYNNVGITATNTSEFNGLSIRPSVGIALKPNLIAGLLFTYGRNKTKQTAQTGQNSSESTSKTVGGGFFCANTLTSPKNSMLLEKHWLTMITFRGKRKTIPALSQPKTMDGQPV